ncbi:MAG: hypothetical protein AAF327_22670 [Cyanobacteria bacterium P01_A01_bin.37]
MPERGWRNETQRFSQCTSTPNPRYDYKRLLCDRNGSASRGTATNGNGDAFSSAATNHATANRNSIVCNATANRNGDAFSSAAANHVTANRGDTAILIRVAANNATTNGTTTSDITASDITANCGGAASSSAATSDTINCNRAAISVT